MPQKKISQDQLCPLCSSKQGWLRYKRVCCGEAFLWVRTARAEKTHIRLTPSASHEEVSMKKKYKGEKWSKASIENRHRSPKITCTAGLDAGKGLRRKNPSFNVAARLVAEMGLVQHPWLPPASVAEPEEFLMEQSERHLKAWNTIKPQQFNGQRV